MSDISAWKDTTQPYSSSNEHYYATLETAELELSEGCNDDLHIDMAYNYEEYSSDRGSIYVDWYNADGTILETTTLVSITSDQRYTGEGFDVERKASLMRLRFVHDMGTWYRNGYWWSLDNLLIRTSAETSACSEPGTATWVGGDGSWTNTANWCDGRLPRETDDVILACTNYSEVRATEPPQHRSSLLLPSSDT